MEGGQAAISQLHEEEEQVLQVKLCYPPCRPFSYSGPKFFYLPNMDPDSVKLRIEALLFLNSNPVALIWYHAN